MSKIRCYTELIKLPTFEERFRYLKLSAGVGAETFGYERYLNQRFYRSERWKSIRNHIIIRDNACDLGIQDRDIGSKVIIHHMNPLTKADIISENEVILLDPEYLICVSHNTHNAIHYGDESLLTPSEPIIRTPNDTCPWKLAKLAK